MIYYLTIDCLDTDKSIKFSQLDDRYKYFNRLLSILIKDGDERNASFKNERNQD